MDEGKMLPFGNGGESIVQQSRSLLALQQPDCFKPQTLALRICAEEILNSSKEVTRRRWELLRQRRWGQG